MNAVLPTDRKHFETGDLLAEATGLLAAGDLPVSIIAGADILSLCTSVVEKERGLHLLSAGTTYPTEREIESISPEAVLIDLRAVDSSRELLDAALSRWRNPEIVVIADRASSAVEAFRLHASAFLVRPVVKEDLVEALGRLRKRLVERRAGRISATLLDLLERRSEKRPMARFPLRHGGRISFVRAEEIDWLEAERDYVCFHVGEKKHLLRARISEMEKRLPDSLFARIHRSVIVNLDRVRELHPLSYGEYAVVLTDGKRLTLSRSHRSRVLSLLTQACTA